jgi:hypothetical protein
MTTILWEKATIWNGEGIPPAGSLCKARYGDKTMPIFQVSYIGENLGMVKLYYGAEQHIYLNRAVFVPLDVEDLNFLTLYKAYQSITSEKPRHIDDILRELSRRIS